MEARMSIQKLTLGMIAPAMLLAASAVQASAGTDTCVFEKYAVSSVAPFRAEENVGYGTYTRLRGVQLYVPAREGLTAEWLTRSVQDALAGQASTPSEQACKPVVPVKVQVVSAGAGFWVQLGAANETQAESLLQWAKTVAPTAMRLQ
jgi:hypothetical protein